MTDPTIKVDFDSPDPVPEPSLRVGDTLAERYRIEKHLGSGGMGVVFRATDLVLEDDIALKVLRARDEATLARFKTEIKLARRIVHTNVCRLYELGTHEELRFVTMELLHGQTLEDLLALGELGHRDERLQIFRDLLAGTGAAHRLGIVHRDLKPQNVIVTEDDGRPVLMDFGLAREVEAPSGLTTPGEILGTPSYMAPEILVGRTADSRADLYSLGVVLHELLTGLRPYRGKTVFEVVHQQLEEDAPPPSELDPSIPEWLDELVLRLLARDPEQRIATTDDVLAALASAGSRNGRRRVLVVDDDPQHLKLVGTFLEMSGLAVTTATSGEEGIRAALTETPDLICLDFRMQGMDGFHVASFLRGQEAIRRTPIFLLTAIQDPQYERQAHRLGIERVFTKPLDFEALVAAVDERLVHL